MEILTLRASILRCLTYGGEMKNTILKIVCCGCDTPMGEKNGGGVEGVTSGFCPDCYLIERLKLAQHMVKTKKVTWAEAKKYYELELWEKHPTVPLEPILSSGTLVESPRGLPLTNT
jgi:hypothetical protein